MYFHKKVETTTVNSNNDTLFAFNYTMCIY